MVRIVVKAHATQVSNAVLLALDTEAAWLGCFYVLQSGPAYQVNLRSKFGIYRKNSDKNRRNRETSEILTC